MKEKVIKQKAVFPLNFDLIRFVVKTTSPVFFGYLAIGIAFGLLLENSGFPVLLAPLMGIIVYAGAAQFMLVGFLAGDAGIFEILLLIFLLNSRHIVYGLSFISKYANTGGFKPYLIYSLTDETYGLLTSAPMPEKYDNRLTYFLISLFNQSYWVAGSTIGAVGGSLITLNLKGLDFALTALFIVLLMEQLRNNISKIPIAIAVVCGLASLRFAGEKNMLLLSIAVSVLMLLFFRRMVEK